MSRQKSQGSDSRRTVFTVGHSTREIAEFVALLSEQSITQLVDIRTIPKSRRNPQFGQEALRQCLHEAGIDYVYMKSLGGLRPAAERSTSGAWRNRSFRNYADYMRTKEFQEGLEELIELSTAKTTAIMCAEAVPWRCHRSLIGDALVARGLSVREIISEGSVREHRVAPFAVIEGTQVTYPAEDTQRGEV